MWNYESSCSNCLLCFILREVSAHRKYPSKTDLPFSTPLISRLEHQWPLYTSSQPVESLTDQQTHNGLRFLDESLVSKIAKNELSIWADIRMMVDRSSVIQGPMRMEGSLGDANHSAPWNRCFICSLVARWVWNKLVLDVHDEST